MNDEPLAGVYNFVERAYVRLQAAAVLTHCMEENNTSSMHQLVEGLVFLGPDSLAALREIQAEVMACRAEIGDDKLELYAQLIDKLSSYGVHLSGIGTFLPLARLTAAGFVGLLGEFGVSDEMEQLKCLQLFEDYLDGIGGIESHLILLGEIELYLQDWLWGLVYQSAHQEVLEDRDSVTRVKWLL